MLWIDNQFASRLIPFVRNFRNKGNYLYQLSCPVCGDSTRNKTKARGYIFRQKTGLFYKCHKCGYSSNLGTLIKYVDENLYKEYVLERYMSGAKKHNDHKSIDEALPLLKPIKLDLFELQDDVLSNLKRLDKLDTNHIAVQYAIQRKIPENSWKLLYYTDTFFKYVNESIKFQFPKLEQDHPRLVIPFFKPNGKCFALQGRAFGNEMPKYFTIKVDETEEKIYGLERVDYSKPIQIVEGPLDSLFLPNALAVSGSSFDTPTIRQILTNATIISDNEPRSLPIVKIIEKNIEKGYKICLFPETHEYKDINEAIMGGLTSEEIFEIINDNTYQGMMAKLRLASWRKC